jgi:prophage tail gpP-like protein
MFFLQEPEDQTITEIWYDSRESVYAPGSSYNTVPDLELTITVNAGEKVLIQFNGQFVITPILATNGGLIRLQIDDTTITGTDTGFFSDSTGSQWGDVSLLYVASGLSAGIHTINIQATVSGASGNIAQMNLLAYTFL